VTAEWTSLDHVAIRTYLRIDAAPNNDAYRVTIRVSELGVVVETIERDVGAAIHAAAEQCAKRLRERGCPVTARDVLDSLRSIDSAEDGAPKQGLS
jgi:hypothetical protein